MEHVKLFRNLVIAVAGILVAFFILNTIREHTAPTPLPETPTTPVSSGTVETTVISEKGVTLYITLPDPKISYTSPIQISGRAPGNWFFEANAPVTLVNWDGLILGEGHINATGDWMTTDYVPFTGSITFSGDTLYNRGALIFKKDNASGLPEHDDSAQMSITIH
jgi:hypothetical protein